MKHTLRSVAAELKAHVPFTALGAASGVVVMVVMVNTGVPRSVSKTLFEIFHPLHVLLSALVTAGMYRRHSPGKLWATVLIGYVGAVGIATLSDCIIPYLGEWLLDMPNRGVHVGFIDHWWLVNPLALAGIALAYIRPTTKIPHAGHTLLSTWASLFHIIMATGQALTATTIVLVGVFLFLAVWVPCCTSDIVFPLLFTREPNHHHHHHA
jgi:hypothetical protein